MVKGARGAGGGPNLTALFLKRAMSSLGTPISMKQAGGMLRNYGKDGNLVSGGLLDYQSTLMDADSLPSSFGDMARGAASRVAPMAVRSASNQAKQIAIGQTLSSTMFNLEDSSRKAAGAIANMKGATEALTKAISFSMGKLAKATEFIATYKY